MLCNYRKPFTPKAASACGKRATRFYTVPKNEEYTPRCEDHEPPSKWKAVSNRPYCR